MKNIKKLSVHLIILAGFCFAQIPQLINYQGYLTDNKEKPLSGNYSIKFLIYQQLEGGNNIWNETQKIDISDGIFNVLLGSEKELSQKLFDGNLIYLALKVGNDEEMVPRKLISSVAFSFKSLDTELFNGSPADSYIQTDQVNIINANMLEDNAVTLPKLQPKASGDNLGDHNLSENLKTNGNWISEDGDDEGIYIGSNGSVGIGTSTLNYRLNVQGAIRAKITNNYVAAIMGISEYTGSLMNSGGYFSCKSPNGTGVTGSATATTGADNYGGYFYSQGEAGIGVYGGGYTRNGITNFGGYFTSDASLGRGLYSVASGDLGIGVYGEGNYYAGYFEGNVNVNGTLSKSAGSFRIDHPLDPENKYLQHSFVESPDMMNVYNGNIILDGSGEATVELPDYFDVLNMDFRYQLTPIGAPGPNLYIAEKIQENRFRIAGGETGMEVSWMVTGIRNDNYAKNHRIQVEVEKNSNEKGKYNHPKDFNQPESKGMHYEEKLKRDDIIKNNKIFHQKSIEQAKIDNK